MAEAQKFDPRFRFIRGLPQRAKVLDAGCGGFKTLKRLLKQRPDLQFYAVDIVDVSTLCPAGVVFAQADIDRDKIPFADEQFDAIFFCHVLEHLYYPLNALAELKRLLKPGGKIYIEGPSTRALFLPSLASIKSAGATKAIGDDLNFYDNFTHVRPLSKRSLHMFLEMASCEAEQLGHSRNPFKAVISPLMVLAGLLTLRRRWICIGLWELVGWSVYAVGRKKGP